MSDLLNLSTFEFSQKIQSNDSIVIIDVRTPKEFSEGHIPNSQLIDIYNPTFPKIISELDKSKDYYIYCRSGIRSYHAGVFMLSEGFKSVQHLKDGIISWTEKLEK
jgi:rhodanese-related sulfurtransferase